MWTSQRQRPWTTTTLDAGLNDSAWWRDQVRRLLLEGPMRETLAQIAPVRPRQRRREPAPLVIEGLSRPLALPEG
jgi:hypothetical protein